MIELYLVNIKSTKNYSQLFQRYLLAEQLHLNEDDIKIARSEYGKPYLINYANIHFNVSHTINAMICAISEENIGVDIERIKSFNIGVAKKYFTKQEQNYIFKRKGKQDERFVEVWTRKEAYVKWTGKGMKVSFQSFDTLKDKKIFSFNIKGYFISLCSNCFTSSKPEELFNFIEVPQELLLK